MARQSLVSTRCGPSSRNSAPSPLAVVAETRTPLGRLAPSSRDAMFTVSPHTSYANLRLPITPAITGPEWIPTRSRNGAGSIAPRRSAAATIRSARPVAMHLCSSRGDGTPATAM